jgi:xanthine dehydrogenase accessory factor
MVVDEHGSFRGSVSGGCIEGAVIQEALAVIGDGHPRTLSYGVTKERAWEVGLSCGGQIEIFVENIGSNPDFLARVQALRRAGTPFAAVIRLHDGARAIVHGGEAEGPLVLDEAERTHVDELIRTDRSGRLGGDLFARVYNRPVRLVLVGAVHIAQALVSFAAPLGLQVIIIDPRTAFATADRFPGITLLTEWPDRAMAAVNPDRRTAVVTLSHDPKLDDPALMAAFPSEAFFIGCLGSRRTHQARVARLRRAGVNETDLARLHAPVGLPLGGRRPPEIAVSILAEIIQTLHRSAPA